MARPSIVTSPDPVADAARLIASALEAADAALGAARLAIPGGSALAAVGPARRQLAPAVWSRVRLTWVDERCVAHEHADSNIGAAYRARQLDPSAPPAFELPLFLDGETPKSAQRRVAADLQGRLRGGLDVVLLGLGDDGHIASLFPQHPALHARGLVEVVLDSPKPPPERVTLTLPMLCGAGVTVLLATGEGKRPALESLLLGDARSPAASLTRLTIVTDLGLKEPR